MRDEKPWSRACSRKSSRNAGVTISQGTGIRRGFLESLKLKGTYVSAAIKFYALRVHPQSELKTEAALKEIGYEAFTPIEWKWRRVKANSNRRRRWAYPMFIRYAFVGITGSPIQAHHHIASEIEYYQGMLGWNGKPYPLKTSDVEALQAMSGESVRYVGSINPHKAIIAPKVGGLAQIIEGPLQGTTARVSSITNNKARLALSEKLLGMDVITVAVEHLEAV